MPASTQARSQALETEFVDISGIGLQVSRVALGTWVMGGWMWGGTLHDRFLRLFAQGGDKLDWPAIGGLAAQDAGAGQTAMPSAMSAAS
jgi:hypothetical protein